MRHRPKPKRRSIIITEILCLMIFAAFLAVLRLQSFATEALAVYEDAHPTVLEMYISDFYESISWRPTDTIFIQDTVWRSLAHPSALRKKTATIYEVDCIKILELHLDRDTLNISVKNNPMNIESSFAISIRDPRLPHVLDSLRRIGLQPNIHQLIYSITISDETVYQNMITMMDEILNTMLQVRFYQERISFGKDAMPFLKKLLPSVRVVKSKDAVKARKEYFDFRHPVVYVCGGYGRMSIQSPPPAKPSIPMIFLDYLNPFGKNLLHTKRWWLYEKER
ncbi:MAG: hypothetical protein IPM69_16220 [Ignavibacteria bacterium]|nr:hypothetical protein [Ignavibacteria bacterium]